MPKRKSYATEPEFDSTLQMIAYVALRILRVNIYPHADALPGQRDNQVVLTITGPRRGIDLSNFTVEELDIFECIVTEAVRMARPMCEELDRQTEEARQRNDIRYKRIWRAKPRFIDLRKGNDADPTEHSEILDISGEPGNEREHSPSLPSGPGRAVDLDDPEQPDHRSDGDTGG